MTDDEIARLVGNDPAMTDDERDDIRTRTLLDPTGSERLDAYLVVHPEHLHDVPNGLVEKLDALAKKPLMLLGQIQDTDIPLEERIAILQKAYDDSAQTSQVLDVLILAHDNEEQVEPEIWRAMTRLLHTGSSYGRVVGPVVNAAASHALAAMSGLTLTVGEPGKGEQTYLEIAGSGFHVQLVENNLESLQLQLSNPIGDVPWGPGGRRATLLAYLVGFTRSNPPELTHAAELDSTTFLSPDSDVTMNLGRLEPSSWYRLVLSWQR